MKDNKKDSYERLNHIQKAISEIETFTHNIKKNEFIKNPLLTSAVLFQFSVVGEAVVHIDNHFLEKYEYPWYKVRAFRNLISHEYFQIKLDAVWDIIINDLPELKRVIDRILDDEF